MSGRPLTLRRHAWSLAGALAAAILAPVVDWQAWAEPPEVPEDAPVRSSDRSRSSNTTTAEKKISLNHLSASWADVLKKLADDTDSTLEMEEAPPGNYSRHDWKRHTRRDAVRILNRDLEKTGFRIVEKDETLKVVRLQKLHVDYTRPVIGERRAPVVVREVIGDESTDTVEDGVRVVSHEKPVPAAAKSKTPSRPDHSQGTASSRTVQPLKGRHDPRVQQVQLETTDDQAPAQVAVPESQTSVTYQPTRRKANDIARQIHAAFGNRSQLADAGPNDLPAFVVTPSRDSGTDSAASFTVEIDTASNELIITSGEQTVAQVESLMRMLDKVQNQRGQKQEIVAGPTADVAERLQPELSQLISDRRAAPARRQSSELAQADEGAGEAPVVGAPAELFGGEEPGSKSTIEAEEPQPGAMSEEGAGNRSPQDQLPSLLDTLKGDVSLESMPDLDLLILRGNEKDVEAVMRVIRTIEQMAEGSTPEIHLRTLEHVDSQSLATLLTQVYERMTTLRGTTANKSEAQVSAIPIVTPNAILILAPANALDSVLKLVEELDKQVDPQHQVEVFPLENAIASQVVTTLNEFYPNDATQRPGLSTRIRVSADARTNSVIVQAQPRDMEEVRKVIEQIDKDTAGSVAQAKIIKLNSANAEELAQFLTQALQSILTGQSSTGQGVNVGGAGGQNAQQLRETKSVVLEFMSHDQTAQELIRSGLLTDVRVNADPRTNSLMITAPKQSMGFMVELVQVLDQPSTAVAEIKVFTLKNADAADAVTLLEALFQEETTSQNSGAVGVQLAGATDAGSNLVPIKFSTDGRTNSVVAIGGADALRIVEAVLLRLDDNDARTRTSEVIKLRNNPAADIATSVNQYLQSQRDLAQIDPDRISSSQLIEQEVIVTAEPLSNSLIISATPRYKEQILNLISELDREPQQVAIQALLVEVTLQDNDEFGVELGFQDSILFDRSLLDTPQTITTTTTQNNVTTTAQQIISQSSTPGFPFNNLPLGNNIAAHPSKVGSQGLSSFSLGRTNSDLGYGGLVLSASSESVNVLIRALSARRNVRVLSRPSVTVLDNQVASIQVGQIVPVTDGASIGTNGNVIPTILRDNAGIILTVTPRISQDGQVVMEVAAEKSQYTGAGVTILTDTTGREITSPIKDITTATTTVKIPDGQTIVMGGMITNSEDTTERKVPWLGDIPVIGQAFRFDSFVHKRTELLIFLTPRVIRCDEDAEQLKQIEAQRIHWFEDEAEMIHGPIFAVPGENSNWEAPATLTPRVQTLMEDTQPTPTEITDPEAQPIQQMKAEQPARQATTKPRGIFNRKSR
jgi:general secretion pathway protein D